MTEGQEVINSDLFSIEKTGDGKVVVDFTQYIGANIWTFERLYAFLDIVSELEADPPEGGVVFMMGDHFGADVKFFRHASAEEFHRFIDVINEAFNRVEALPCQTVAVFGHCYGGGFELALACDKRLGVNTPKARIGLTEVRFGLFPGAGGTQRLPKLVGNHSFSLIANGKAVSMKEALRLGMVDRVVEPVDNVSLATDSLMKARIPRIQPDFSYCDLVREAVREDFAGVDTEPHRHAALKAIYGGLFIDPNAGLAMETRLFKENCPSAIMEGLIDRFLACSSIS